MRLPCLFLATALVVLLSLSPATASTQVLLGIDVLERGGFAPLKGKRVGLLTHPAGVNSRGVSSVEILHRSPAVNLVALFGPEHGIYGDQKADVPVDDQIDTRTGLPVYSLYGKYRKPTPAMLRGLDVLVVDLQDIGTRSYTFVSCMLWTMEACFEAGVEVIVLDRPNPLGGLKVDGPMLDRELFSYVGAFPAPYVHGLTIGEIAAIAKSRPGWLRITDSTRERGRLRIMPMQGWRRNMLWSDTGLAWVPTSPAIPDLSSVLGYPMTGLGCQLGAFSHGYGTPWPFRWLTYRGKTPEEIQAALEPLAIPGLSYLPTAYRDRNGNPRRGLYVVVDDWNKLEPTALSFHMMTLACRWSGTNPFANATPAQQRLYNIHVGSMAWWEEISTRGADARVDLFLERWRREAAAYQNDVRRFWIYQ
jgi:uncharacterized protein YbbC (DUF1343 family)